MILIDYNHLIIEGASYSLIKTRRLEPKLIRFIFLKKLLFILKKFKKEYGLPVILKEGKGYWRRDIFPLYKAQRAEGRSKDTMDWGTVYDIGDLISLEMSEVFKIPVFSIYKYEADDLIASIVREDPQKHMIISRDKDFIQLKFFGNVNQWDIISKKMVELPEDQTLDEFYVSMIMKGQRKDGVPCVFADDDWIVESIRQPSITKNMIDVVSSNCMNVKQEIVEGCFVDTVMTHKVFKTLREKRDLRPEYVLKNLRRNVELLDFKVPLIDIDTKVSEMLEEHEWDNNFSTIFDYMAMNNLNDIAGDINEFLFEVDDDKNRKDRRDKIMDIFGI